ncbi:MAG: class I SAM-dependent methyltransferase [Alphaproteobacteria bacterium]|jgi:SAM-dependent methyltransferase|nr:class I SAM-dependent methyltransferase [Alphaproteobacteria bacterium]MDP6565196.1 class I SAM-dependent methyltransferase [Alphaproteobacteria bacterium]MDP6811987.1 class I SAM-dependent methyltransferase [Alphaproteobacteria bacterium]
MTDNDIDAWLHRVYGAGGDDEKLAAAYDRWAGDYDAHLSTLGHCNPAFVGAMLARYVRPGDGAVLDAGAGTGQLCEILTVLGFDDVIGIDLSEGMLAVARQKNLYRELHRMTLGQPLDFATDHFAAAVSAGVLTVGHAPPSSFDELIRVVRPGGHLAFSITDKAHAEGGFAAKAEELTAAGRWRPVDRSGRYVALPLAGADTALPGRAYVFEVA